MADVIGLSETEFGTIELNMTEAPLRAVANDAVELFRAKAVFRLVGLIGKTRARMAEQVTAEGAEYDSIYLQGRLKALQEVLVAMGG